MICRFSTLTFATFLAVQAQAAALKQDYPGWIARVATSNASGVVTDLVLNCGGEGCAGDTLQCVVFHKPTPIGVTDINSLKDENNFPRGWLSFWLAASIMQERRDLLGIETNLSNPTPPVLVSSRVSEVDVVSSQSEVKAGSRPIQICLAFWLQGTELHGLRCSYSDITTEQPDDRVIQLLRMLLAK